jgi:4-amino-4-deoxy-L-arabinose transferase-like glycosyltransferase
VSPATAAARRRHLRTYLTAPADPETGRKHPRRFRGTAGSATVDLPEAISLDFAEPQQVRIAATAHLAEAGLPRSGPAAQPDLRQPQFLAPGPEWDTGAATAGHDQAVPLTASAGDRRRPAQLAILGLIVILTVQVILCLRLVWSNTAYIDEATYLWAGHLEIAHLLHGAPVPLFQTWFSGAPVIYPPIAAVADHLGGLSGARFLSLVFMTGVTALLWNVTSRLFGHRAAFFAAALFAVLGPTQFLGALATYDALALLLMATSVWCVVAARDRGDSTLLLVAGATALALANAAKYATALFDPVVVVLAALVIRQQRGRKPALGRAGYLAAVVTALVAILLALGGPFYVAGVMYTTLARAAGDNSPLVVLTDSWKWAGAVCALAWVGVVISPRRSGRGQAALLTVLAAAGMLAPLEQARIHTITSLHKHVDFGAWLAAPAAGYALAQLSRIGQRRSLSFVTAGLLAAAIVPLGALGAAQARDLYQGWPDSAPAVAQLRALTRAYPGNYLAEDYDIPAYYLQSSVSWPRWSNTWYLSYTPPGTRRPLTGAVAYRAAIASHHFSLVILDFLATPETDSQIVAAMQQTGDYQVVAVVPSSYGQYTIWGYRPAKQSEDQHGHL